MRYAVIGVYFVRQSSVFAACLDGRIGELSLLVDREIAIVEFAHREAGELLAVIGVAVLILAGLHSVVDFLLQIPGVGVYFAAIMAAAVTVSLRRGPE
jgi:hypothetical protein